MPTCNQCGEEIEFRYVNGRSVPIHPGGGWHCGSFSEPSYSPPIRISRAGDWPERDFTRPSHCPMCGDDVFFIRHNGGSVWVDELGWPWPKHACFDKPSEPTRTFSNWTAKSSGLTNPKLAIITRIKEDARFAEPILEIRFTDSSRASLILRYTPSTSSLLGALVIISKEDSLLLHQQHAEIPFHSLTPLVTTDAKGYYTCPRCKAWVNENTGHEEYCREHYNKATPAKATEPTPKPKKPKPVRNNKHPAILRQRPGGIDQRGRNQNAKPAPQPLPPTKPSTAPTPPSSQPQRAPAVTLDDRIGKAVESVARDAWSAVTHIEEADERFRLAKHEVLRLIAMLSPAIKRQVGNHFTSEKWKPLLAFRPNA